MTVLYAALAVGGGLVGLDAWLRWRDRQATEFADLTGEDA